MKVAIFLPYFSDGGVERFFSTLTKGLIAQGDSVILISFNQGSNQIPLPTELEIVDLGVKRAIFSIIPLIRCLRKIKPNAMISAHAFANLIAIFAVKFCGINRIKLLISERVHFTSSTDDRNSFRKKLIRILMKFFYRFADAISVVSEAVKADLVLSCGINEKKISVIYNPIDIKKVISMSLESVEHPWLLNKSEPVVISVGRLDHQKDMMSLVRAVSQVNTHLACKLIIIGEGSERSLLVSEIARLGMENNIDLLGFKGNPYSYMVQADLFVLSSIYEGLPNVVVEAMALGLPIIATNCPGGTAEVLQNGRLGKLVPPENPETLAREIISFFDQRARTRNYRLLYSSMLKKFDFDESISKYRQLIQ